jgi:sugar lactone lactonase YvrE
VQVADGSDTTFDTGLSYRLDEPVLIHVRHRGHRYDLSDEGAAVELAGRRRGWFDVAQRVVAADGFNVNRRGAVFVPAVEGRDIDGLCARLGQSSRRVYLAVLDLGD